MTRSFFAIAALALGLFATPLMAETQSNVASAPTAQNVAQPVSATPTGASLPTAPAATPTAATPASPSTPTTPAAGTPTAAATPSTPPKPKITCALDEYPVNKNGNYSCKKVSPCKAGEAMSYDTTQEKFVCKKLVICNPKNQQAAYINGKNVCIDIPDCEGEHKSYAFDGTKVYCK